jgi:large subunit ribosomal protein L24
MAKMNIKKEDRVVVISGKDKGKKGKVLVAEPSTARSSSKR